MQCPECRNTRWKHVCPESDRVKCFKCQKTWLVEWSYADDAPVPYILKEAPAPEKPPVFKMSRCW